MVLRNPVAAAWDGAAAVARGCSPRGGGRMLSGR